MAERVNHSLEKSPIIESVENPAMNAIEAATKKRGKVAPSIKVFYKYLLTKKRSTLILLKSRWW